MGTKEFKDLDALIIETCLSREAWELRKEWQRVKDELQKSQMQLKEMQGLRQEFEMLDQTARQLAKPPLQCAIYLGPSAGVESDMVVGLGSGRLEVHMKEELRPLLATLQLGQIVLLNENKNVVAVRSEYIGGMAAEVVNIIVSQGEGKIVRIEGEETPRLVVLWRENEEIIVTPNPELAQTPVHVGDMVQVDQERKLALPQEKPRLHVRSAGGEGVVVEISDRLYVQEVKIGDIVRIEPGLKFAFEKLPAYETGELTLEEVPDVTYDDIGGLDEQVGQIYDAIELPYLYREQFERYQLTRPKGILLYGPPGCGKTMVAKAVANSLTKNIRRHLRIVERCIQLYQELQKRPDDVQLLEQVRQLSLPGVEVNSEATDTEQARLIHFLRQQNISPSHLDIALEEVQQTLEKKDGVRSYFLNIKGPELLDKYVGETEHRIRKIFEEARSKASYYKPVVIFFDEMEAMFRTRGSGRSSDIETTIVPQFLTELDGIESASNLIIIGASNRQDMIDPAILRPKRLDVKVKVDRPSRTSARDIFSMYLLPTLPLSEAGLSLSITADSQPVCIFRTAYPDYYPPDDAQIEKKAVKDTAGLLPKNCDFRLALSLRPEDLAFLARFPAKTTVRDVLSEEEKGAFRGALLRFNKLDLELEQLLTPLQRLQQRLVEEPAFHATVELFIRQEWLAEMLLLSAIELLYGTNSVMSVLTNTGTNYTLLLQDFMSGAIIANIVDRAKRQALKRMLIKKKEAYEEGISQYDLRAAIEQEFTENKEQLSAHKLHTEWHKLEEDIKSVELLLEGGESDPWSEFKIPLYQVNKIFSTSR